MVLQPKLWDAISEDGSVSQDDYYPNLKEIFAIALINGEEDNEVLHGFVIGRNYTDTIAETHIAIAPEYWGDSANVPMASLACGLLFELANVRKLVASIPVTDKEVLRFGQRIGFEREGMNKKSFLRQGELLDQYYVGLTREKHGQSIK